MANKQIERELSEAFWLGYYDRKNGRDFSLLQVLPHVQSQYQLGWSAAEMEMRGAV